MGKASEQGGQLSLSIQIICELGVILDLSSLDLKSPIGMPVKGHFRKRCKRPSILKSEQLRVNLFLTY